MTNPEGRSESHVTKGYRQYMYKNLTLDKLEEQSVCIVLTKAIEKLRIIQQTLPNPNMEWNEPYQPMSVRMTILQKTRPPEVREPENIVVLKHIQKCRSMSHKALKKAMQEAKGESEGMLLCLKHVFFAENLRYCDNFLLKQESINLNNTLNNLKDKISEVNTNSKETRLYLDKMTQFCLEQAAVTAWAQSKTLLRNTEVSQQARAELLSYKLRDKENNVISLREQYSSEILKEELINSEITNHIQMVTVNSQKKFEKWTARYSEEVDVLDISLLQLRSKMDEQQEKFFTMSQQHKARQEVLEVLQTEADERDRKQEMRLAQTKAAIIIQQWWREILFVRHVRRSGKKLLSKKGKKDSAKKKKK